MQQRDSEFAAPPVCGRFRAVTFTVHRLAFNGRFNEGTFFFGGLRGLSTASTDPGFLANIKRRQTPNVERLQAACG
jgi:hypothetical protein